MDTALLKAVLLPATFIDNTRIAFFLGLYATIVSTVAIGMRITIFVRGRAKVKVDCELKRSLDRDRKENSRTIIIKATNVRSRPVLI